MEAMSRPGHNIFLPLDFLELLHTCQAYLEGWSRVLDESFLLHPQNSLKSCFLVSFVRGKCWFYLFIFFEWFVTAVSC